MTIFVDRAPIGRALLLSGLLLLALVASCAVPGSTSQARPATQQPAATQQPTATGVVAGTPTARPTAPAPTAPPPTVAPIARPPTAAPTARPPTVAPPAASLPTPGSASTSSPPAASAGSTRPGVVQTGTPPIVLPGTAQLSAPSRGVLWALMNGQYLFRSLDSGTTWEQRGLPSGDGTVGGQEVSFVSEREGWLLSPGSPATQCMAQAVSLWHTTDAGSTWQPITPTGIEERKCKDALVFVDALRGFLAAWDPNSPPVLYRTTDGGRTWAASAPLPDAPGFTTRGAGTTLRAGRVRAFGATLLLPVRAPSGQDGYVYRSSDGGASWTYAATAPLAEGALGVITATRWIALRAPGQSLETTDGGVSWHAYATDYAQAAPIAPELVFADDQVGYATVRGLIQRSQDGGAHWSRIPSPGTASSTPGRG